MTTSIDRDDSFLTLNVGRGDGIEEGMAVIGEHGIVGRIVLLSDHYAQVMPTFHTDFRVAARVQPTQSSGIVRWPGTDPTRLLMEYVVKTEDVEVGQEVVTSQESRTFPEGFTVGTIDSIATQPGRNQLLIYLDPAVAIDRMSHVFVVLARPDPEQVALENQPLH